MPSALRRFLPPVRGCGTLASTRTQIIAGVFLVHAQACAQRYYVHHPTPPRFCSKQTHTNNNTNIDGVRAKNSCDDVDEEHELREMMSSMHIASPSPITTAQRERLHHQHKFLTAVMITKDEQEWRDMLSAALRLGAWRDEHLIMAVGYITRLPLPPHVDVMDGEARRGTHNNSTPSTRLQRIVQILLFTLDEPLALAASTTTSGDADAHPSAMYRPSNAAVHAVLVQVLTAAETWWKYQHSATGSSSSSSSPQQGPAMMDGAELWHLLSWMELHDYHVESSLVLQRLENLVDCDASHDEKEDGHDVGGASPSSSTSSSARGPGFGSSSYAVKMMSRYASRRVHRLGFIEEERVWQRGRTSEDGVPPQPHHASNDG